MSIADTDDEKDEIGKILKDTLEPFLTPDERRNIGLLYVF